MERIASALIFEHDHALLLLSVIVCAGGLAFSLSLLYKAHRDTGTSRSVWLAWSALVGASSFWTAHIIALAAHDLPANAGFRLNITLIALAVSIAGFLAGYGLSTRRHMRLAPEAGGMVLGLTAGVMGLTVFAGREFPGVPDTSTPLTLWSAAVGAYLGAIAMGFLPRLHSRRAFISATLFLVMAGVAMHLSLPFAGPSGAGAGVPSDPRLQSDSQMIAIAMLFFALTVSFAVSGWLLDRHLKESARRAYQHLSLQDTLTHLPNRTHVLQTAPDLLRSAARDGKTCAVVLISLDQFKVINDLHGYEVGDLALRAIASTLKKNLGDDVLISRFYGDEFLLIHPKLDASEDAVEFARLVRSLARRPIATERCRLSLRMSIGLAVCPRDGSDLAQLVQRANLAAKQAKSTGGNLIQPYVTGMEESNLWEASLASDLRNAALEEQLTLVFQKQNLACNGDLVGYEALVRWRHAEKGPIAPEDFIPLAERSGIILDIGKWVLHAACAEAATWSDPLVVAVNASPLQFSRCDFAGLVSQILLRTGLPAERLEIELTESTPIEDHNKVHQTIVALRDMGVRVAMDDFGKGYSSLNTLQAFPFDKIKVDRSFTRTLETDPHARAILRSAVLLGHSFEIPVIAEGVETESQLRFLKEAGFLQVQGFLYGKHLLPGQIKKKQIGIARTAS
jgi:diguanylate cyclase (GGDEF)-like protein